VYDFIYAVNSNFRSIFNRFRNIASFARRHRGSTLKGTPHISAGIGVVYGKIGLDRTLYIVRSRPIFTRDSRAFFSVQFYTKVQF